LPVAEFVYHRLTLDCMSIVLSAVKTGAKKTYPPLLSDFVRKRRTYLLSFASNKEDFVLIAAAD
jgi:hypothetical protein